VKLVRNKFSAATAELPEKHIFPSSSNKPIHTGYNIFNSMKMDGITIVTRI